MHRASIELSRRVDDLSRVASGYGHLGWFTPCAASSRKLRLAMPNRRRWRGRLTTRLSSRASSEIARSCARILEIQRAPCASPDGLLSASGTSSKTMANRVR